MKHKLIQQSVRNNKGFLLLATYMVISVVAIFSLALFTRVVVTLQSVERAKNKAIAFNMAEAGLDFALAQLNANANYTGTGGYVDHSTNFVEGGYQVTVTTPAGNANVRQINVTGHSPDNNGGNDTRAYENSGLVGHFTIANNSLFNYAIFSKGSMKFNGNAWVDSYDSSLGPYGQFGNTGTDGDIATNAIGNNDVTLFGNVDIDGTITIGPGGDPSEDAVVYTSGNTNFIGEPTPIVAAQETTIATPTTTATSEGVKKINGNNTETISGTHYYDSLEISGNGELIVQGSAEIYVNGPVKIAGNGITTADNLPKNLIIYVTETDPNNNEVKFTGNGQLYAGVVAPNSLVRLGGNSKLYGAVIANKVDSYGNAWLHFDTALKDVGGTNSGNSGLTSWQETNTTAWDKGY